jgi:hypothetical protein
MTRASALVPSSRRTSKRDDEGSWEPADIVMIEVCASVEDSDSEVAADSDGPNGVKEPFPIAIAT